MKVEHGAGLYVSLGRQAANLTITPMGTITSRHSRALSRQTAALEKKLVHAGIPVLLEAKRFVSRRISGSYLPILLKR